MNFLKYIKRYFIIPEDISGYFIIALFMAFFWGLIYYYNPIVIISYFCLYVFLVIFSVKQIIINSRAKSFEKSYSQLEKEFNKALDVCKEWEQHSKNTREYAEKLKECYYGEVKLILENTKDPEIFPQQQAILSNLVNNAVQAPAIKSIMEFTQQIKSKDTIFLIRVNHQNVMWYIQVAGRTINLNQALYVMDEAKRKLEEMSGEKSLIQSHKKIGN